MLQRQLKTLLNSRLLVYYKFIHTPFPSFSHTPSLPFIIYICLLNLSHQSRAETLSHNQIKHASAKLWAPKKRLNHRRVSNMLSKKCIRLHVRTHARAQTNAEHSHAYMSMQISLGSLSALGLGQIMNGTNSHWDHQDIHFCFSWLTFPFFPIFFVIPMSLVL